MLAPPPPPTPPYAMSESSAMTSSDLDDAIRRSKTVRGQIQGPYAEGELLNLPYPYHSNDPDGIPHEALQWRKPGPTRAEVERRIREQEKLLAMREKGVNKDLFMIRRTKLYRLYHGSLANLPASYAHRPPPLPGQKDTRGKRLLKELPPLKGVPPKQMPPPPPAPPPGPQVRIERPETPVRGEGVDLAEAERLRRAEALRLQQERAEAYERAEYARDLVTGMRGVGQFALQPDFSRLAVLQDLARRCSTQGADLLDDTLELTVNQLAIKAKDEPCKPWEGVWRAVPSAA